MIGFQGKRSQKAISNIVCHTTLIFKVVWHLLSNINILLLVTDKEKVSVEEGLIGIVEIQHHYKQPCPSYNHHMTLWYNDFLGIYIMFFEVLELIKVHSEEL